MPKKRVKKTKRKSKKNTKVLTYIAWFLAVVAIIVSSLVGGYFMGYNDAKEKNTELLKAEKSKTQKALQKLQNLKEDNSDVKKKLQKVLRSNAKKYTSASHEIEDVKLINPPKQQRKKVSHFTKPKLAIIIDDVSTASQVRAIKALHLPLTMSFLPPSKARPNSAKLAARESFYMVHLPMEAMHFSKEEPYTLRVDDSQQEILKRIGAIKELFPRVHYINNHTGSKFTADEAAMQHLIYALRKNNIYFIDSRTTAQTKAPKVTKEFGLSYVARDIFLDHHMEKKYVKEQIVKAVEFAKKHGHAIAIGHPHVNTLAALRESKPLLKTVDLVLVNKVYR